MNSFKKYIIQPGWLTHKNGLREFVSAGKLMELYGVEPSDCVVSTNNESLDRYLTAGLIALRPKEDGDYDL